VITDAAHPLSTKTVIVELPNTDCTAGAFGRAALTWARHPFEHAGGIASRSGWNLTGRATVTGPDSWDFNHNQHGVASNPGPGGLR